MRILPAPPRHHLFLSRLIKLRRAPTKPSKLRKPTTKPVTEPTEPANTPVHSPHFRIIREYTPAMSGSSKNYSYTYRGPPPSAKVHNNSFDPSTLLQYSIAGTGTLPAIEEIKAIHIYDFDNTLFLTPLPNPRIWHGPTLNNLQSPTWLRNGGWWHDPRLLQAVGKGIEEEEKMAWKGSWNEDVVELVRLSMQQKDALTVLLTGRSRSGFEETIRRMVESKGLRFDLIVLKMETVRGERVRNTIGFKTSFLEEVLDTYSQTEEMK